VLSFWFTRGANCIPAQDALDEIAPEYRRRVNFLSINVRDDPGTVRSIAQEHGWSIPVGYDRDGAVSDLYRVGGCPTVAFAYAGGILAFAKLGDAVSSQSQLAGETERLLRLSRARAKEAR
jgi:hypothetical protein